jgi:Protein of unknown function (DUF3037)
MQEKLLYEYAVIRIVPRVEREEFINAGVILFCKKTGFLDVITALNSERLLCMHTAADLDCVKESLASIELISKGDSTGGPIALLDAPSRFRWLTATRSTIIQTSRVHPGLSHDPAATLLKLFKSLVI